MKHETKILLESFQAKFKPRYHSQYWIDLIDNQYADKYSFILYEQHPHQLTRSHILYEIRPRKEELLEEVLREFQHECHISINDMRKMGREPRLRTINGRWY